MMNERAAPVWMWLAGLALVRTACVVLGWQLALVPEAHRPAFRTAIWGGAVMLWLAWQRVPDPLGWLGLWPVSYEQIGWTALAFALVLGGDILRAEPGVHFRALALGPETYLGIVVGVFVEEVVFRGVLQTRLAESGSPRLAVALAALASVATHVPGWLILQIPVEPGTAFSILLIGYVCGLLRYASRSLWPAVAAYLANNLGAML